MSKILSAPSNHYWQSKVNKGKNYKYKIDNKVKNSYDNVNTGEVNTTTYSKSQEIFRNLIKKEKSLIKSYVNKTLEKIRRASYLNINSIPH